MKKVLSIILAINIFILPACSQINDTLVEKTLDKSLKIKHVQKINITDDFVENSLDDNSVIKIKIYSPIIDSFAEENKNRSTVKKIKVELNEKIPSLAGKKPLSQRKKVSALNQSKGVAVQIKIKEKYTTKSKFDEGDYIDFVTTGDVALNNKTYPKGTLVKARIETISQNKPMGVPSDTVISNFSIENIPLFGEISKMGSNRSLWVCPIVYGTCWFFGIGLLCIPIRGGHAKIDTDEKFTVYFYD